MKKIESLEHTTEWDMDKKMCKKSNEIIDAVNELIELNQSSHVRCRAEPTLGDLQAGRTDKECPGILLPCEKPIFTMLHEQEFPQSRKMEHYLGNEKYWKCSRCGREVK